VRFEFFPRVGEVLAVSGFYKTVSNAIEEELLDNPERFVQTWFNSPSGKNYGFEVELRKSLGFLGGALDAVSVMANYTKIESEIDYVLEYTDENGAPVREDKTRTMQGQAPWMVNVSLGWEQPHWGTSASVLFNRSGRRLDSVGDSRKSDIFEESRSRLDLALTQTITEQWKAKLTGRNLLDEKEVLTWGEEGRFFRTLEKGVWWSLSLSYQY
jgi:outer membrane receptor protein involved in Fe transport